MPWNTGFLTNYSIVRLWSTLSGSYFIGGKAANPKSFREGTRKRREATNEQNDEVAL